MTSVTTSGPTTSDPGVAPTTFLLRVSVGRVSLGRVGLGVALVAHALLEHAVFTLPATAQYVGSPGAPSETGYLVFAGELIGGTMLILGVYARYLAIALLPVLLGATWAHAGNGSVFSAPDGGWEYPLYLGVAALAQFLPGDGPLALRSSSTTRRSR